MLLCVDAASLAKCNVARESLASEPVQAASALLVPCRAAMHGRMALHGTYFQINEVFYCQGNQASEAISKASNFMNPVCVLEKTALTLTGLIVLSLIREVVKVVVQISLFHIVKFASETAWYIKSLKESKP